MARGKRAPRDEASASYTCTRGFIDTPLLLRSKHENSACEFSFYIRNAAQNYNNLGWCEADKSRAAGVEKRRRYEKRKAQLLEKREAKI